MPRIAVAPHQLSVDRDTGTAIGVAADWVAVVRRGTTTVRLRALTDPAGPRALAAVARRLPVVDAAFSGSPAGHELRAWFGPGRALPLDRVPIALLPLPATEAEYLRGRARQALRTNVTRALEAGGRVSAPGSAEELFDCIVELAARRRQPVGEMVPRRPRDGLVRHFAVAWDGAGEPVALTETIIDGPWAGLAVLVSDGGHPQASPARYLLHLHTVRHLLAQDVQQMVVGGSMLLTAPGVRYFQQRTGFVPVRLRPARLDGVRPRDLLLREPPILTLDDLLPAVMPVVRPHRPGEDQCGVTLPQAGLGTMRKALRTRDTTRFGADAPVSGMPPGLTAAQPPRHLHPQGEDFRSD